MALRGLTHSEGRFALVMEYCPRGTLDVLLHHTAFKRWEVCLPLVCVCDSALGRVQHPLCPYVAAQ